jgi:hypothetical protein
MSATLTTYLHDHLAGARFATSLLNDLARQELDGEITGFAAALLLEVQADQDDLQRLVELLDSQPSMIKEASAWLTQKLGRLKFQLSTDPFGIFEALEVLSLGILGKIALWNALQETDAIPQPSSLDLDKLLQRAREQYANVETHRLRYARQSLVE